MPASLHIGDGLARIGGVTLPARASARGLELGSDAVLRPVSFGLRARLVAWSGDDLPAALLGEMLEGQAAEFDSLALQALALHMAGADSGAPGFSASAALVARLLGWPLAEINAGDALEIDRLAASLAPSLDETDDGGWTTIHFSGATEDLPEDEALEALCARLTADLQRRAADGISQGQAAVLAAVAPAAGNHPAFSGLPSASGYGSDAAGASGLGRAGTGARPAEAPVFDPPPDPWQDHQFSPLQPQGFGTVSPAANLATPPAHPLPERGPDAAVWAQPAVDGNPALAYRADPDLPPKEAGQPETPLSHVAGSAVAPTSVAPLQAQSGHAIVPAAFSGPGASGVMAEGFEAFASRADVTMPLAFAGATAPTRADLFWQAVAAEAAPTGQLFPRGNQQLPTASQPLTQTAADTAMDLDGIADALHTIADLRGVAR